MARRGFVLAYAIVCYCAFLGTFSYLVLFTASVLVPKTVDDGAASPLWYALTVDVCLMALFGVQHSVMARTWFKRWWTRIVPAAIERSTYVLIASVCLVVLVAFWVPMPGTVWRVDSGAGTTFLWSLFMFGWVLLVSSTFIIDHWELFGLKQAWATSQNKELPAIRFKTPSLYRIVRHPMMVGFLFGLWATPHMTVGHLVFSAGMSAYIFVGILFEERDLVRRFGGSYLEYKQAVPKLVPRLHPTPRMDQQPIGASRHSSAD